MAITLTAGPPLETPRHRVGRSSALLVDATRADRVVLVDTWYPSAPDAGGQPSVYELLPGVGFTAGAEHESPIADGRHPLMLWSHGQGGTRFVNALLCEAIAARGFIVVAPEHAGDTLADWMLGVAVDDATNQANRVADARFVLDAVFGDGGALGHIGAHVDSDRVAAAGHSYGGFTALSVASEQTRDPRVRAAAGLQSFTRPLRKEAFEQIAIPTLLVVGAQDTSTPAETDADRAWAKLGAARAWRVDVERAGHQACSDVGLYLELAPHVPDLPDFVSDFLGTRAGDVTGRPGDPWRETVALQARILAVFLTGALEIDAAAATHELESVGALPGVNVSQRGSF